MTTIALYEISAMRDVLDRWLDESEGEMTPELEALMGELDAKADEKIERVALYIRERLAQAAAVEKEVERITWIQKREERAAASLKAYLQREMERLGKTKVVGLLCTVALQTNAPSVQHELTADDLANAYHGSTDPRLAGLQQFIVESQPTHRLDKDAVKQEAKAGYPLPPSLTITQSTSLRIR